MPCNLRHDHPRLSTLTRWHSHAKLSRMEIYGMCENELPTARLSKAKVIVWQPYRQTVKLQWSLPVTWQQWRLHHSICRSRKPYSTHKLHDYLFIEPELWTIEVYIAEIGILDVFGSMTLTLTLTRWLSYMNFVVHLYTGCADMNFLCQGFQKLSSNSQTDIHVHVIRTYVHTHNRPKL